MSWNPSNSLFWLLLLFGQRTSDSLWLKSQEFEREHDVIHLPPLSDFGLTRGMWATFVLSWRIPVAAWLILYVRSQPTCVLTIKLDTILKHRNVTGDLKMPCSLCQKGHNSTPLASYCLSWWRTQPWYSAVLRKYRHRAFSSSGSHV